MSFLKGKSNLSAIISKNMIQYTKDNFSLNSSNNPLNVYTTMPTNLISTSTLKINCGNTSQCSTCLKNNNIDIDDYNIDIMNKTRDNECFSVCSCKLTNIDLENNLVFLVGTSINYTAKDRENIASNIRNDIMSVSKTESSEKESINWTNAVLASGAGAILGGPTGALASAAISAIGTGLDDYFNPVYNSTISENVSSTISNVSESFQNTINQLISSSQDFTIEGTGIKVKNVSLQSLQDITMKSSQVNSTLNNLTNSISDTISDPKNAVSKTTISMLDYIWEQNKKLVITMAVVFILLFVIWIYLEIKTVLKKK